MGSARRAPVWGGKQVEYRLSARAPALAPTHPPQSRRAGWQAQRIALRAPTHQACYQDGWRHRRRRWRRQRGETPAPALASSRRTAEQSGRERAGQQRT
eukprot:scaffold309912_cov31-Tisochrysis_lutea.AAC.2